MQKLIMAVPEENHDDWLSFLIEKNYIMNNNLKEQFSN